MWPRIIDHRSVGIEFFVDLVLHTPLLWERSEDGLFLHAGRVEDVTEVKVLLGKDQNHGVFSCHRARCLVPQHL